VKRKVGLFLLGVIAAVTPGATLVVSLAIYRLVSANQDREIRTVEASLSQRFTIFEVMLRSQHARRRLLFVAVAPIGAHRRRQSAAVGGDAIPNVPRSVVGELQSERPVERGGAAEARGRPCPLGGRAAEDERGPRPLLPCL